MSDAESNRPAANAAKKQKFARKADNASCSAQTAAGAHGVARVDGTGTVAATHAQTTDEHAKATSAKTPAKAPADDVKDKTTEVLVRQYKAFKTFHRRPATVLKLFKLRDGGNDVVALSFSKTEPLNSFLAFEFGSSIVKTFQGIKYCSDSHPWYMDGEYKDFRPHFPHYSYCKVDYFDQPRLVAGLAIAITNFFDAAHKSTEINFEINLDVFEVTLSTDMSAQLDAVLKRDVGKMMKPNFAMPTSAPSNAAHRSAHAHRTKIRD
ncbi:hypothetical protein M885DRAFT_625250 [Pelagophyceae sp. CCMP2097]|nr:hypothetical protein M885DRAFT_625250 [Pelagophyceae sp. CCMP2097]